MTPASLIGWGLALYVGIGIAVAIAFIVAGVGRVVRGAAAFTPGARLLILPGATALWPYVLIRWLKACSQADNQT